MPDFPAFQLTKLGQALKSKLDLGGSMNFTKVSTGAGLMPPDNNVFSAVANGDTVTITNSENGDVVAADVDTGFTVAEVTPGDAATAEVTSVQCLAASTLVGGEYFLLASPYLSFYVFFTKDGVGGDPKPAGKIGIQIDLAGADTAVAVAALLATALDHHRLDLTDLKTLINSQQDLAIQSVTRPDDITSSIKVVFSNAGLAAGYYFCEIGIFATDPDLGEILYAVSNAADKGDNWPADGTATLIETEVDLLTVVSSASDVTITVDLQLPATKDELAAHDAGQAAHPEMRQHGALKDAVRVATTGAIVLEGLQTVDDVVLEEGDPVLVKDQVDKTENGLRLASAGPWPRREDADTAAKLVARMIVPVKEGAVNANTVWWLTTEESIVMGTTDLNFFQPFAMLGGSADHYFFAYTPTQFDNGPKVATTTFVKKALGNASAHTVIDGNVTLAAINAGNICYFIAAAVATLPLSNTVAAGTVINFVSKTSGATSAARQGADIIEASSTSNALTSMALIDGETLALESNGVDRWVAIGGSAQLKYAGGFAASLSSTPWQTLPSGLIVQRGTGVVTGANTLNTFPFPLAFPNACLVIKGGSNSVGTYAGAVPVSNSQFNLFASNTGAVVAWDAVGY